MCNKQFKPLNNGVYVNWKDKSNLEIIHEIGIILRDRRITYKLSQDELAKASGLSVNSLNRIENGKGGMNIESLLSLFKVLGMIDGFDELFRKANMLNSLSPTKSKIGTKKERVRKSSKIKTINKEWTWGDEKKKP